MCLAIPLKIIEIKNNIAIVASGDHTHETDISLIKKPKVGEYLLVHADMAINKLPAEEAKKIIEIVEQIPHKHTCTI